MTVAVTASGESRFRDDPEGQLRLLLTVALALLVLGIHVGLTITLGSGWTVENESGGDGIWLYNKALHGVYRRVVDTFAYLFATATALMLLPRHQLQLPGAVRRLTLLFGGVNLVVCLILTSGIATGGPGGGLFLVTPDIIEAQTGWIPLFFRTSACVLLCTLALALFTTVVNGRVSSGLAWLRSCAGSQSALHSVALLIYCYILRDWDRWILLSSLVALSATGLFLCINRVPRWVISRRLREKSDWQVLAAENDIRTSLLQVASGLVLVIGVVVTLLQLIDAQQATQRQLDVTVAGQTADRFARAVDQLERDKGTDVQQGAIYTFDRLADDSPEYRPAIIGTLSAYITGRRPIVAAGADSSAVLPFRTQGHLQAALTVLLKEREGMTGPGVDLSDTNLDGADLTGLSMKFGSFDRSSFASADLTGTNLSADVETYQFVSLRNVSFRGASFSGTGMAGADLTGADFGGARISDEQLDLSLSNLAGADLSSIDPARVRLDGAYADDATKWPVGFGSAQLAAAGVRRLVCQEPIPFDIEYQPPPGC